MSRFKEMDDKLLPSEVGVMAWSPKMDLLSVANTQGEVVLYRLTWQKVWALEAPAEGVKVTCLCWRPDGKSLAVGYSNCLLVICDTEDKEVLITHILKESACLVQWVSVANYYSKEELEVIYKDDADDFLPPLLSLNKWFNETSFGSSKDKLSGDGNKDAKKLDCQPHLNLLICVSSVGYINFFVFGIFSCLECKFELPTSSTVPTFHSVSISSDYSVFSVIMETNPGELQMMMNNLPIFTEKKFELHILAAKHVVLTSYFTYLASTIRSIIESWEEILVEIDTKLAKYAAEKKQAGNETVSDDFLELLMFGNPTSELQTFLLHDLSEKGLKKLGHSIELTYSNIQKLVLKHVQPVGLAIYYHLADLCGLSSYSERFSHLGLNLEKCEACLREAGSFMLKATELQQVIDYSMINFKAFFRWLYGAILRLSDEQIPSEIAKTSEQDLNIVAQFLKDHFSQMPSGADNEKFCFNLERVGQYLKKQNLTIVQDQSKNPWVSFLESNPSLKNELLLFPYQAEKSLIQQHDALQRMYGETRYQIADHNRQWLKNPLLYLLPYKKNSPVGKVLHKFCNPKFHYILYVNESLPCNTLILLSINSAKSKAVRIFFEDTVSSDASSYKIQDFQFYTDEVISVLLIKDGSPSAPILAQVSIKKFLEQVEELSKVPRKSEELLKLNGWDYVINGGGNFHRLSGVVAHSIEVSGTRHVACITISKRRVRILELDLEDEEEEGNEEHSGNPPEDADNATNSSKDSLSSFPGLDCSERMEESDENKENCKDS